MAHDRSSRGLAVRAGDAQQCQIARRITVYSGGGDGGGTSTLADNQRRKRRPRRIFNDGNGGTTLGSGVQEIMAVTVPTANRDKQIATRDFPAIVRYARGLSRQRSVYSREEAVRVELGLDVGDANAHSRGRVS
jgi:hypothetical protein